MCLDLLLKENLKRLQKASELQTGALLCALFLSDYSTQKQMDKVSFSCPISVRFPSDIKHMAKATAQRDCFNINTESQHRGPNHTSVGGLLKAYCTVSLIYLAY